MIKFRTTLKDNTVIEDTCHICFTRLVGTEMARIDQDETEVEQYSPGGKNMYPRGWRSFGTIEKLEQGYGLYVAKEKVLKRPLFIAYR